MCYNNLTHIYAYFRNYWDTHTHTQTQIYTLSIYLSIYLSVIYLYLHHAGECQFQGVFTSLTFGYFLKAMKKKKEHFNSNRFS